MNESTSAMISQDILKIIENSGPLKLMKQYNLPNVISDYFGARWEWGWGIDARISVWFSNTFGTPNVSRIEVSWSTGGYSPSQARTAASLHSQVADLACRIQAMLEETTIIKEEV